jgi:hypothetical protein
MVERFCGTWLRAFGCDVLVKFLSSLRLHISEGLMSSLCEGLLHMIMIVFTGMEHK